MAEDDAGVCSQPLCRCYFRATVKQGGRKTELFNREVWGKRAVTSDQTKLQEEGERRPLLHNREDKYNDVWKWPGNQQRVCGTVWKERVRRGRGNKLGKGAIQDAWLGMNNIDLSPLSHARSFSLCPSLSLSLSFSILHSAPQPIMWLRQTHLHVLYCINRQQIHPVEGERLSLISALALLGVLQ